MLVDVGRPMVGGLCIWADGTMSNNTHNSRYLRSCSLPVSTKCSMFSPHRFVTMSPSHRVRYGQHFDQTPATAPPQTLASIETKNDIDDNSAESLRITMRSSPPCLYHSQVSMYLYRRQPKRPQHDHIDLFIADNTNPTNPKHSRIRALAHTLNSLKLVRI